MLLPRAVIEKVGYLDETLFMYCEDVDYCIRLAQAGVPMWFLPDAVIHHKAGGSAGGMLSVYYITRNTLYLTCKGKSRAYAKRKTVLPILTGAARYALTKALGRKKGRSYGAYRGAVDFWNGKMGGWNRQTRRIDLAQTLSIILAQYYPDKTQLRHTLDSLLIQDTYDFELIIADDGSPEDYWEDTRDYLAAHGFTT